ncbi:unnamed protein product, partial [Iphiclides podalirius]
MEIGPWFGCAERCFAIGAPRSQWARGARADGIAARAGGDWAGGASAARGALPPPPPRRRPAPLAPPPRAPPTNFLAAPALGWPMHSGPSDAL